MIKQTNKKIPVNFYTQQRFIRLTQAELNKFNPVLLQYTGGKLPPIRLKLSPITGGGTLYTVELVIIGNAYKNKPLLIQGQSIYLKVAIRKFIADSFSYGVDSLCE